jgi:hypothetical protein
VQGTNASSFGSVVAVLGAEGRERRARLVVAAWPWLLAAALLGPALLPGYLLSYDMVAVPQLALRPDFLGVGSGLPRAVPSDAVVAVLDQVVPGMLLQKVVLLGSLGLAGVGAGRLAPRRFTVGRLAATTLYVWNPFVAERLVLGHWTLLVGYAALPWLVDLLRRPRADRRTSAGILLCLVAAATSPSGGVTALVVVLAFGSAHRRRVGWPLAWWAAANAPWVVAGLLHASNAVTDPVGARVFAAHAEGSLPAPIAVLGLGGVWNAEVVPGSRLGVLPWVSLAVVLVVCALGVTRWRADVGRGTVVATAACAVLALVVANAGAVAPGTVASLVTHVPGAGLLRDGSRYLGLLAVPEAWLFGYGAVRVAALLTDRTARSALATGLVLLPVALLPDAAWGVAGSLRPAHFPASYAAARTMLDGPRGGSGDLLVLPFSSYRAPSWNGGRKVLDPLGRYLTPDYVAADDLLVSGHLVRGEDPRGPLVRRALALATGAERARALARLGIGRVVTETDVPGARPAVAGRSRTTGALRVTVLKGPVDERRTGTAARLALTLAWLGHVSAALLALLGLAARRRRRGDGPTPARRRSSDFDFRRRRLW